MRDRKAMNRRDFGWTVAAATGVAASQSWAAPKPPNDLKLGLYSITYLGLWYRGDALTLEQVIRRAEQYGYDGVEVDGKRPHGNPLDLTRKRCQELRKYAEDAGVKIYAVAANNDFSSPMPEFRESQLLYLRELIRMTADLNAKLLRVFLAWPGVTARPEGGGRYDLARGIWDFTHKEFTPERTWDWCREGLTEAARFAGEYGVTLALQNHAPVVKDYRDALRMIREVNSPHLKACFDTRLEYGKKGEYLLEATRAFGALQVLSHYGDEYDRVDGRIVPKEDEFAVDQAAGLLEIGYRGYLGYELCHPLPLVNGQLPGIDFVDKNVQLAAEFMREAIAEARRRRQART